MNKRNMKILLFFVFLMFVLLFPIAQAQNVTISKDVPFRLSAYNTYLSFSDNITASRIEVFMGNITFYDVQMGTGPTISKTSFSVINANITVINLFTDQRLTITLDAPSGTTSQTKVYWPYDSTPTAQCNCTDYGLMDFTSRIATLNVTHPSVVECSLFVPTPPSPTTVPSGNGGGPGPTKLPIEEPKLTYSMPASLELYENETKDFTIKVVNPGTKTLHNITINILGIPKTSYSLIPTRIDSLKANKSTYFTVLINTQNLTVGSYTLRINITSEETSEETTMTLKVKEIPVVTTTVTTTTIPPEEEEKIEAGVNIIKILSILAGIIAVAMIAIHFLSRKAKQVVGENVFYVERGK